jgi:DNA primase
VLALLQTACFQDVAIKLLLAPLLPPWQMAEKNSLPPIKRVAFFSVLVYHFSPVQNFLSTSMADSHSWEEAKERVRTAADIVQVISEHVQLRRAGAHFTGLCPFHNEKTPSFSVNPQRQTYKCFGCGESGDIFSFLTKYQNLSFPEALRSLAQRYQVSLPEPKLNEQERAQRQQRELLIQINTEAARLFHEHLIKSPQAEAARQYLARRGVPHDFIEKYQIGYAPPQWDFLAARLRSKFPPAAVEQAGLIAARPSGGHYDRFRDRIMFPICDLRGRVTAFGGRILGDGQPKYMNSPESLIFSKSKILFGLWQHREQIRRSRRAVLVEGNFDLLLLAVHGIANTVAPLGTALTRDHIRTLRSYCQETVLLFDGDAAGLKAALRAVPLFLAGQLEAKAALLPSGTDPDSFVREQGPEALRKLLDAAQPLPEFVFDALVQEHGLTLTGKSRIMTELQELIKQSPDSAQQELMAAHFSSKLNVSSSLFFDSKNLPVQEAPPFPPPPAETDFSPAPSLSAKERQLLDFLLFYPEFFKELMQGGLAEYAARSSPLLKTVLAAMQDLAEQGLFQPEQLLGALPARAERKIVADLLLRGAQDEPESEDWAQDYCKYLCNWFQIEEQRRRRQETQEQDAVALLQKKIFTLWQTGTIFFTQFLAEP